MKAIDSNWLVYASLARAGSRALAQEAATFANRIRFLPARGQVLDTNL